MNIKTLFQKRPGKTKPVKLNTTTRRATVANAEDYDSDEPNVRLSRAFLVVMLLHVVAVGGIFAFSSLKKNTPPPIEAPLAETPVEPSDLPSGSRIYVVSATDTLGGIASTFGLTRNDLENANHLAASAPIQRGDKLIIPAKSSAQPVPLNVQKLLQLSETPKAAATVKVANNTSTAPKPVKAAEPVSSSAATSAKSTGEQKIYVVQKGDNPVLIAKRQGISYADLIEVNHITDPKKLQIGQKLIIPQK